MNIIFLTQVTGFLKPFAWVMGVILNAIYEFMQLFGVENIALCIVLFTFVVKMLMLPLTIKQQKYTRLSSKMSPEITAIQEKYKGKKDEESMRRQQAETQEVYAKYGTSPMGGCLPMLISLPILFALYRVIYAVPAYVKDVGSLYTQVADSIQTIPGYAESLTSFIDANQITNIATKFSELAPGTEAYTKSIIDVLVKFTTTNWNDFFATSTFASLKTGMQPVVDQIISINNLFGLSILDVPKWNSIAVIIPILAVITQFIQGKLQGTGQPETKSKDENPMGNSAKMMTTFMPLLSGVFCLMFPIGVGVYWIATAVFTTLQTIFINKYLDKTDIDEMIERNVEKANKKKAKLGVDYGSKMAEVAKASTKTYVNTAVDNTEYKKGGKRKSASGSDYVRSKVSYSASSIAANANLLAGRNSADSKTQSGAENSAEENTDNDSANGKSGADSASGSMEE